MHDCVCVCARVRVVVVCFYLMVMDESECGGHKGQRGEVWTEDVLTVGTSVLSL